MYRDLADVEADAQIVSANCSFWLRDALKVSMRRDPVDAVDDAEVLLQILHARLHAIHAR